MSFLKEEGRDSTTFLLIAATKEAHSPETN